MFVFGVQGSCLAVQYNTHVVILIVCCTTGFYDTSEDVLEIQAPRFGRLQKSDVMGVRRDHVEAMERRKDREKQKEKKETDLPAAIMQMNK